MSEIRTTGIQRTEAPLPTRNDRGLRRFLFLLLEISDACSFLFLDLILRQKRGKSVAKNRSFLVCGGDSSVFLIGCLLIVPWLLSFWVHCRILFPLYIQNGSLISPSFGHLQNLNFLSSLSLVTKNNRKKFSSSFSPLHESVRLFSSGRIQPWEHAAARTMTTLGLRTWNLRNGSQTKRRFLEKEIVGPR